MSTENPFVGPSPLVADDGIFGRDEEIRELFWFFVAERIVWLHSPSGAGKTSLVQAGLIPKLIADDFDVLPTIRVNRESAPGANRYEASMLFSLAAHKPPARIHGEKEPLNAAGSGGLEDFLRVPGDKSRVLIFDQFEEILTVDSSGLDAKRSFAEMIGRTLQRPDIWALFVIREDFLAALDPLVRAIPTQMNNRFRLDLLRTESAEEAMKRIAARGNRQFRSDAASLLADELARVRVRAPGGEQWKSGAFVEPMMLQVVCRSMWNGLASADSTIEPKHVPKGEKIAEALADYYAESIQSVCRSTQIELKVRRWFGEKLIASGLRNLLLDTGDAAGLGIDLADALVNTHLIRRDDRGERIWYELAHDQLVEPVLADNNRWIDENLDWLQKRAHLWRVQGKPKSLLVTGEDWRKAEEWMALSHAAADTVEAEFLNLSREEEKARKKTVFWTRFAWSAAGVILGCLIVAIWSYQGARAHELINRAYLELRKANGSSGCASRDAVEALGIANNLRTDLRLEAMEALSEALQAGAPAYEVSMGRVILAWSASTSLLAVASDNYVNLYRFPDPAVRFRWEIPTDGCSITRIALKRDGSEIAIGVSTGEIARRRVAEDRNEEVRCASSLSGGSTVQALSFSQAGELVSASPNGIAIDGRTISRLDATSLAFRPGGQILAAGTREGTIHLLDEEGKEVAASIRFGDEPVTGMAWSKNALAAVSRGLGLVRVWDDRGQEVLHQDSGLSGLVAVAVSTAGKNVAVSGLGEAQQTRVYRLQENDSPLVLLQPPANEAVLSDLLFLDENRLLIGDSKGAVRLAPLDSEGMRKSAKEFMAGHPCLKSAE